MLQDPKLHINALLKEAYQTRIADLQKSEKLAKKALKLSRQLYSADGIGRSLNQLSLFCMIQGNYKTSVKYAKEAIKHFAQLGDEIGIANAKYNIAGVYYKTNNYHSGLIYLMDCLGIYKKYGDYHNQALAEKSLGTIYEYIGDTKSAIRSYEQCIEVARKISDVNLISNAYNPLSGIYLKQGKIDKALKLIEQSIAIKTKSGDIRGLAFALYGRAKIYTKTKQFYEAERDFKAALKIHTHEKETLGTAMALYKLGFLYYEMSKVDEAKKTLKEAVLFSERYNIIIVQFKSNYLLYNIFKQEKETAQALEYLEKYLRQKEAVINTQTLKVIENYEYITRVEAIENDARAQKEKAEILEKKEIAEQTAKIKQDFLSTMSHEIRTPLNAVITISSLLADHADNGGIELIDSLKFASNSLLLIINDILDFTKLDAGKVELNFKPTSFRTLINQITRTYEKMALGKGLEARLKFDDKIARSYELDETKISQILGNLISNGIKYTDVGSVELHINKLSGDDDTDVLRFAIHDTGVGIPEDHFYKLFDSFSQPKSITTRKQGGTGLGLAIVKKLVQLHNSEVCVKSEIGKGSVFHFDLVLKKSLITEQTIQRNYDSLMNRNILLAEDNMINALVARKLLAKWGITAEHAKNGLEAIAMAKEKAYDVILMDIHMPEMNGFDAAEHIRNNDNPNTLTPIFALTADITAEYQTQYANYFTGFLTKPIEIDKLHRALVGQLVPVRQVGT